MFGIGRRFTVLAVAAALAVGAAGCGGGDDDAGDGQASGDTAASATTTAPSPAREPGKATRTDSDRSDSAAKGSKAGGGAEAGSSGQDEPSAQQRRPDRAPSGPIAWGKKLGDGSIQRYGRPASSEVGAQGWALVQALLDSRAKGDWEAVCSHLAKRNRAELQQLAKQAEQMRGKSCGFILEQLVGAAPAAAFRREASGLRFVEMRVYKNSGFVLFESAAIPHAFVPVVLEGGEWKSGAPGPTSLEF